MSGFVFAVISSLFYSLYVVPRKFSRLSPVIFSFFMSIGFSISAIILYLFQSFFQLHETLSLSLWWSVLAGMIWASAIVCFVKAIDMIGLARSNQWKNLQGPVAVLFSLLLLSEFTTTHPFFAIFAAITIFLSAICFTIPISQEKHLIVKGVLLASFSAFGFGIVAVMQKYVTTEVGIYSQLVVWSVSIMVSLKIYILSTKKVQQVLLSSKREKALGLLAGIIYLGASLFQFLSYQHLAASIAFTVIQLNALWTVLIGIFVFKEIHFLSHYKRVGVGFLLTVIGIMLLVFARK